MEEILYYIAYILETVFETYVIARLMGMFLEYTPEKKKYILGAWVLRVILGTLQYIFLPYPSINLTISIGTLFLIVIWYNGLLLKKIMVMCLIAICQLAAELFAAMVLIVKYSDFELSKSGRNGDALSFVIITIALWIISEIIYSFQNIHNDILVPRLFNVCIIILGVIIFLLEITMFTENVQKNYVKLLSVIYLILVLLLIVYLYDTLSRNYTEKLQVELIEREKNYYCKQTELLRLNSKELRAFRHDSMNHLCVVSSMLGKSDEEARQYIEKLIGKMQEVDDYCNTGNTVVDSVINYKLGIAEQKHIEVVLQVMFPENLDFAEEDLVTILGNLLDNAIEATEKAKGKKYIHLDIKYKFGALLICIKNSYDGKLMLRNGKLLTTKQNKLYHGIGLKSVQATLKSSEGHMEIKYDDKEFEVNIILYI